jgi:hypothetical protein
MKNILRLSLLFLSSSAITLQLLGQGLVNFSNLGHGQGFQDPETGELMDSSWSVELLGGSSPETLEIVSRSRIIAPGFFVTGTVTLPGLKSGDFWQFQFRFWQGDTLSYERAGLNGATTFETDVFSNQVGGQGVPPTELTGYLGHPISSLAALGPAKRLTVGVGIGGDIVLEAPKEIFLLDVNNVVGLRSVTYNWSRGFGFERKILEQPFAATTTINVKDVSDYGIYRLVQFLQFDGGSMERISTTVDVKPLVSFAIEDGYIVWPRAHGNEVVVFSSFEATPRKLDPSIIELRAAERFGVQLSRFSNQQLFFKINHAAQELD